MSKSWDEAPDPSEGMGSPRVTFQGTSGCRLACSGLPHSCFLIEFSHSNLWPLSSQAALHSGGGEEWPALRCSFLPRLCWAVTEAQGGTYFRGAQRDPCLFVLR